MCFVGVIYRNMGEGLLKGIEIIQWHQSLSQQGWQLTKPRNLAHTVQSIGSSTGGRYSFQVAQLVCERATQTPWQAPNNLLNKLGLSSSFLKQYKQFLRKPIIQQCPWQQGWGGLYVLSLSQSPEVSQSNDQIGTDPGNCPNVQRWKNCHPSHSECTDVTATCLGQS